jgi:hypothetical protein
MMKYLARDLGMLEVCCSNLKLYAAKKKGNTLLKPSENVGNVCRQAGIMLFP